MKCADCQAFCCSIYLVTVSDEELNNIAAFCSTTALDLMGKGVAIYPNGHLAMMARKVGKLDYCAFIDAATMRCGVYAVRPEACRKFHCAGYEQ
jgi:Fe-S-cluster containining protein